MPRLREALGVQRRSCRSEKGRRSPAGHVLIHTGRVGDIDQARAVGVHRADVRGVTVAERAAVVTQAKRIFVPSGENCGFTPPVLAVPWYTTCRCVPSGRM